MSNKGRRKLVKRRECAKCGREFDSEVDSKGVCVNMCCRGCQDSNQAIYSFKRST